MGKENDSENRNWGGRRAGAGRPVSDTRLYTFRAGGKIAEILDSQRNRTGFIRQCIEKSILLQEMNGKTADCPDDPEIPDALSGMGDFCHARNARGVRLPYFDIGIVAGFPVPLDNDEKSQNIELLELLCPHPESSYLIRVVGDSMIDAGICSGDIVIVDKSNRNPGEHQVAVCEFNGEYTLKRFVRKNGAGWLVPANPEYPEIRVSPDDDFRIWGTVTYIIHKPKI